MDGNHTRVSTIYTLRPICIGEFAARQKMILFLCVMSYGISLICRTIAHDEHKCHSYLRPTFLW
jgi:uncharacterized membrane protein